MKCPKFGFSYSFLESDEKKEFMELIENLGKFECEDPELGSVMSSHIEEIKNSLLDK